MSMGEGTFKIKATGSKPGTDFQYGITNDKECIAVSCVTVGGDGAEANRVFAWYGWFNSEDNQKRTFESLKHLGWNGDPKTLLELPGLGSKEANGVFQSEEYEGKTRLKLSFINDPNREGAAVKNKLEGADLQAFQARMAGQLAKFGGGAPAATAHAPHAAAKPKLF